MYKRKNAEKFVMAENENTLKGVKSKKTMFLEDTLNLAHAYTKGNLTDESLIKIFRDRHVGDFLTFLNHLKDFYVTKKCTLENCVQILFGEDKADEAKEFFKSTGLDAKKTKRLTDKIVQINKPFFNKPING